MSQEYLNENDNDKSYRRSNYGAISSSTMDTIEGTITAQRVQSISQNRISTEIQEGSSTLSTPSSSSSSSSSLSQDQMRSTLSFLKKIGFGLGHIYNDLCAGVWFSYTLLFMQAALLIPAPEAGALVMLGQISDAISTPIVGILADRYGTKRQWHIFGTGLVFISFPMIFSLCPWCNISEYWWPPVYFSIFIIIFQFAWAVVQISHLSMIPEMSITIKDRADLTATRYSASVCSNVIVYIVTWILLQGHNKFDTNIGPSDAYRFRDISLILTLMGLTMSVLFHFSLSLSGYEKRRILALAAINRNQNESFKQNDNDNSRIQNESQIKIKISNDNEHSETDRLIDNNSHINNDNDKRQNNIQYRKNFLKSPLLYVNALLYVFSRLFMTTSLVYMPLWLDERSWQQDNNNNNNNLPSSSTLLQLTSPLSTRITISSRTFAVQGNFGVDHLATVPLVSFLASFVASLLLKHVNRWIGHQLAYLIGSIICIIGCIWIAVAAPTNLSFIKLFSVAILFGAGSSITMISSLCITADMIGRHTYQGGFIYSAVTFADKFITGIVVVIIETIKCKKREDCPEYYRNVLAYGCGIAAIFGILILILLKLITIISIRRRNSHNI